MRIPSSECQPPACVRPAEWSRSPPRGDEQIATAAFRALAAAPIGLAVFDRELRFVYVNAWMAGVNGVPAEAHAGRTLRDLFPDDPEPVATIEARIGAVLESGAPSTFSVVVSRPEDHRREWVATYFPIVGSSGDVDGACGLVLEVTADRDREAAQARARAEAERMARRLGYLQDVTAALSAARDPSAVAAVVVERARDLVGAVGATFRVLRGDTLEVLAATGDVHDPGHFRPVRLGGDVPVCAAATLGEPLWLEDRAAMEARFPRAAAACAGCGGIAALPLAARGRQIGTLAFMFDRPRAFDLEDRAFLLGVAEQSAQALDRALLHDAERASREAAQRASERVARLQAVTAAMSGASTAEEVATGLVHSARDVLGAQSAIVYLLEPERAALRLGAAAGRAADAHRLDRLPLAHPHPASRVARTGEPCWLETRAAIAGTLPRLRELVPYGDAIGAIAALPLRARGEVLGSLGLSFDEERAFGAEDRELLSSVADQCAQALDRARLLDAEREARAGAQRVADRLARLQEITAALAASRTAAEIAEALTERVHAVGATVSSAYLLEPDGSHLRLLGSRGAAPEVARRFERIPVSAPFPACHAAASGEPVWLETREEVAAAFPEVGAIGAAHRRSAIAALPLRAGGKVIGSLGFSFDRPRRFDDAERNFFLSVVEQCGVALDRARLLEDERRARADAEQARVEADRARALLDAIVENAPLGIGFLDREFRFRNANPKLAEMNGFPVEAHLGRTPRELLPGLPMDDVEAAWRRVLETGEPLIDVEIVGETRAAGGRVWMESWYPVRSGGETIGIGALVRDVTKEREAELFQRHVLGVVGHDLRNPLSAIVTATKLLGRHDLPPPQARLLGRIAGCADRIEEIVRALLDFARVRGGMGVPITRRPCDLADIACEVAEECRLSHPGRQVDCTGEGDCAGEWDPDRIAQLLTNLVSNALDYSPEGAPVWVRWRGGEREVVLEVANAGPPIPPEVVPRLFEPFLRGETGRRGGLGLGLFIAGAIAGAHRGRIDVRSSEPAGTVFTVRLPRE